MLPELTIIDLDTKVMQQSAALVMIYKPGCPWCNALRPTIAALAGEYQGRALVGQINLLEFPELRERFGVKTVPFVAFFKGGQLMETLQGDENERTKPKLMVHLDACLAA